MTEVTFDARTDLDFRPAAPPARRTRAESAWDDIRISVHHDLAEAEADWRGFECEADGTVFQSFGFVSTWQRHVGVLGGVRPAIVIGRDAGGHIMFLLPLGVSRAGLTRRLMWLGSDLCDYNGPLLAADFSARVSPGHFMQVWQDVTRRLQDDPRLRYDVVDFEKMPATVGSQPNPFLRLSVNPHPSGAYLTPMSGDWDSFYLAKRTSSSRKRDRAKRKKLGEHGAVRLVTPDRVDDIAATLDLLMAQKGAAFAQMGVANLFAKPGYAAFYRDLATNDASRALVHVSRLDVAETKAALNLGLMFRGRYYHVLASYDAGELSRFGAGAVHLQELMRHALEHGCSVFDFTIGDEAYKRDWCDGVVTLHDHLAAARLRGAPQVAMLLAMRRVKRRIKQTPALWSAYAKARAVLRLRR
jgi:CelD/BcsL family acetyltransferase involved in cellulose biosynthesis